MAKLDKKLLEADFWHSESERLPDIYETRKRLAKVTNQRLRRLEKSTSAISGEAYTYGAYDIISDYIDKNVRGKRFSEQLNESAKREDVIREITAMQRFLSSSSSTVAGQRKAEEKRVLSFINKGVPEKYARSKEFYDFLSSKQFEHLGGAKGAYTSEQIIEQLERAGDEGVPISKMIDAFSEYLNEPNRKGFKDLVGLTNAVILENSENK